MDKNLNDIKLRILQFVDFKGLTRDKFFTPIGLGVQNFKGKALESALSADSMIKILSAYPEINPDWLMYGSGKMLKNPLPNTQFEVPNTQFQSQARNIFDEAEFIGYVNEEDTIYSNGNNDFIDMGNGYYQMMVPLIEDYAYAGYLSGYSDEKYLGDLPRFPIIVQKQHKGSYRSIRVKGDSMDDNTKHAICSGDVVVGRKIEKDYWKSKIHYTTWPNFIIVHEDGIVIKSIIDHDVEKGTITCRSLNPDKDFYPDFKLHLNNVYELYNIVQIIRLNF